MSKAQKTQEQKKQFNMEQVMTMWLKKGKSGTMFVTGVDAAGSKIIGFFNGKKQNPKEPDVRIYYLDENGKAEQEEYTSLWMNVSKNDKKYLSGKIGTQKVVGFINNKAKANGKVPYFSVYISNAEPPKKKEEKEEPFMNIPDNIDEELPFGL